MEREGAQFHPGIFPLHGGNKVPLGVGFPSIATKKVLLIQG